MQTTPISSDHYHVHSEDAHCHSHKRCGVYWSAIIGGAIAATVVSLLLLALGAGLGFSAVSPWYHAGVSAKTLTLMAVIWLVIMQWVSSALGGYLAGRLRHSRWHGLHADDGFFRDTAHGFLAWAISTLLVAVIVSSAASQTMKASAHVAEGAARGDAMAHESMGPMHEGGPVAYYVDSLYRSAGTAAEANSRDINGETARILFKNMGDSTVSDQDRAYLVQLVEARTGLSPADARARVNNVLTQEKSDEMRVRAAADEARKATARFALFTFVAMLVGAFIACVTAAVGGLHRDSYDDISTASVSRRI